MKKMKQGRGNESARGGDIVDLTRMIRESIFEWVSFEKKI